MAASPLARVRRLCLALPETSEKLAWGAPTFRVGRAQKMFATFADHHHGDARVALWLAAPLGKQAVLVASEPSRVFAPPYLGPKGWIALDLARFSDRELALHIEEAWAQVAPKKLAASGVSRSGPSSVPAAPRQRRWSPRRRAARPRPS